MMPKLVLDLDETLVHFDIDSKTLHTRPHLKNFLRNVSKSWELVVFTAGLRDHSDNLINKIDPSGYIQRRYYREHCVLRDNIYTKDLNILGTKDLKRVIIVDNVPANFSL